MVNKVGVDPAILSESSLTNRVDIKIAVRRKYNRKAVIREHVMCSHCGKKIPDTKRSDAKYCSELCKNSHNWWIRRELDKEIRHARRAEKVKNRCECGAEIDTRIRTGPVPKSCVKCRHARSYKRRKEREAARRQQ